MCMKLWVPSPAVHKPLCVVAHTHREGGSEVRGIVWLVSKFEASLGYVRLLPQIKQENQTQGCPLYFGLCDLESQSHL